MASEDKAALEERLAMVMEDSAASRRAAAAATQRADDLQKRLNQTDSVSVSTPQLQQMPSFTPHWEISAAFETPYQ